MFNENTDKYILSQYKSCELCARRCKADRSEKVGYCNMTDELMVARAALHYWEEPCISGENGSGAVFFSGCSLKCEFCQNYDISRGQTGKKISVERLSEIYLELAAKGAHNINLVTPTHFIPHIIYSVDIVRKNGFVLPVVYNTSSYETTESVKALRDTVDIYLADAKFFSPQLSAKYCKAPDYFDVCFAALNEMVSQKGAAVFDENGLMKSGVIVRVLLMPGMLDDAKKVIERIYNEFKDDVYFSLMNQYTPMKQLSKDSPINRKVTDAEYDELIDFALSLGVENGFIQEGDTAEESFIPPFDLTGV